MEEHTAQEQALEIARLLEDGRAEAVTVIDISAQSSWTDCFVIATVSSAVHLQGLARQVRDYAAANGMQLHRTHNKTADGDNWRLLDFGMVVVHLLSAEARGFYELEKLWHSGKVLRPLN